MATSTPVAHPPAVPRTRHEDDLYTWVQEQTALLRAGRLAEIDAANVAEELSDVGKSEYWKLQSAIAVLTQHLLKWDHQPARRSASWAATIKVQRKHITHVLADNPGMKSRTDQALERGYDIGRVVAVGETGLPEATFAEVCPYTFDVLMTRPVVYEQPTKPKRAKR